MSRRQDPLQGREFWCVAGRHANGNTVWGVRLWRPWQVYVWRTGGKGSRWMAELYEDGTYRGAAIGNSKDGAVRMLARMIAPVDLDGKPRTAEEGIQAGRRLGVMNEWPGPYSP